MENAPEFRLQPGYHRSVCRLVLELAAIGDRDGPSFRAAAARRDMQRQVPKLGGMRQRLAPVPAAEMRAQDVGASAAAGGRVVGALQQEGGGGGSSEQRSMIALLLCLLLIKAGGRKSVLAWRSWLAVGDLEKQGDALLFAFVHGCRREVIDNLLESVRRCILNRLFWINGCADIHGPDWRSGS